MTCYLFWVAPPATPQTKIPPHPQPRATCFFDGRNSQAQPQLYQISALIFILSSIKLVKICFKLLKHSIFELQNCNIHLKKGHFNLHSLHYCWKTCQVAIAHRKPKNAPHARTSQVLTKWARTRTSQLATAHRNTKLAIAHRKSCLANNHHNIIFVKCLFLQSL